MHSAYGFGILLDIQSVRVVLWLYAMAMCQSKQLCHSSINLSTTVSQFFKPRTYSANSLQAEIGVLELIPLKLFLSPIPQFPSQLIISPIPHKFSFDPNRLIIRSAFHLPAPLS